MAGAHRALIVEDEPEMAAELADLLRSFGHGCRRAETKADALALLEGGDFCYVLLDLQIKSDRESIKPYVSAGMSLLEETRRLFPGRGPNDKHLLPVIVVSGHAKEHEDVVRAFQLGADDFVRKPLGLDGRDIGEKIARGMEQGGRDDHQECALRSHEAAFGREGWASGELFSHSADYAEVQFRGALHLFTGPVQRTVIRLLHEASKTEEPWQSGKRILHEAGSGDSAMKMSNLFRRHSCWGNLILSDRRGKYRLRTE